MWGQDDAAGEGQVRQSLGQAWCQFVLSHRRAVTGQGVNLSFRRKDLRRADRKGKREGRQLRNCTQWTVLGEGGSRPGCEIWRPGRGSGVVAKEHELPRTLFLGVQLDGELAGSFIPGVWG